MVEVNVTVAMCEDNRSSNDEFETNKSDVWEFFIKLALCKICNKEYAFHGGNSNLRNHLIHAHPSKLPLLQNQASLESYLSHSKCSDIHAMKITEHIVDMVVRDLRPAALVEGTGFKAMQLYGFKHLNICHQISKNVRMLKINIRSCPNLKGFYFWII